MGTKAFEMSSACAQYVAGTGYGGYIGNGALMKLYNGTKPATADTALSGNTLLATLTGASPTIASTSDTGTAGRATWGAITSGIAANTGTAVFGRTFKSDGTTVADQFNVDTSGADLNLSTTSLTAGSTVACSARTNDWPKGP